MSTKSRNVNIQVYFLLWGALLWWFCWKVRSLSFYCFQITFAIVWYSGGELLISAFSIQQSIDIIFWIINFFVCYMLHKQSLWDVQHLCAAEKNNENFFSDLLRSFARNRAFSTHHDSINANSLLITSLFQAPKSYSLHIEQNCIQLFSNWHPKFNKMFK